MPATAPSAGDKQEATPELVLTSLDYRVEGAQAQVQALQTAVEPRADVNIHIPAVDRRVVSRSFLLSEVSDAPYITLGQQLALVGGTQLQRKILTVVADPGTDTGYRLIPRPATDVIEASTPELPLNGVRAAIRDTILARDYIKVDRVAVNAATRLAGALIAGAGGEDRLVAHLNAALTAVVHLLNKHYKASAPVVEMSVEDVPFAPRRSNSRPVEANRYGPFSSHVAYCGWAKSLHGLNWFDVIPERALANLPDEDDKVALWARIMRGEHVIITDAGRYSPDFYVRGASGIQYLVEVKAVHHATDEDVVIKRTAAENWARLVSDHGDLGTWRYVFVTENILKTAKTWDAILTQTAKRE
jgi:type III restriction enzyme